MTEMAASPQTPQRDVGGCPVMHRDFAPPGPAGCYWDLAKELRDGSPRLLQHLRPGLLDLHAPRRRQGHLQDARAVLERVLHAVGPGADLPVRPDADRRARPHQVPADPQPLVLAAGHGSGRGRPARALSQPRRGGRVEGRHRLRLGVRAALPDRGFLQVIGIPPKDADLFVTWVEDFFAGFGGDPAGARAHDQRPARASRPTGPQRWTSAAARPSRGPAISPRTCCTRRSTTAR